jgi:hypothetical protein
MTALSFSQKNFIVDLVPREFLESQKPADRLQSAIAMKGISEIAIEVLSNLATHRLKNLDALVADSACQLRAVENLIFDARVDREEVEVMLKAFQDLHERCSVKIDELRGKIRAKRCKAPPTSLDLINSDVLLLSADFRICLLSALLCQAKEETEKEGKETKCAHCSATSVVLGENPSIEKMQGKLGTFLARPILSRAQELLANESCTRFLELIQEMNCPVAIKLRPNMIRHVDRRFVPVGVCEARQVKIEKRQKKLHQDEKETRLELPAHLTVEGTLQLAACCHKQVLLRRIVRSHTFEKKGEEKTFDTLLCDATISGDKVVLKKALEQRRENHLVIDGFRAECIGGPSPCLLADMPSDFDFARVIRMNTATHPQFTDCPRGEFGRKGIAEREAERQRMLETAPDSQEVISHLVDDLQELEISGQNEGCSEENPAFFCTFHVCIGSL